MERVNGYLRRSFYVALASRLAQSGQRLDVVSANVEVVHWLAGVVNARIHGTTKEARADTTTLNTCLFPEAWVSPQGRLITFLS